MIKTGVTSCRMCGQDGREWEKLGVARSKKTETAKLQADGGVLTSLMELRPRAKAAARLTDARISLQERPNSAGVRRKRMRKQSEGTKESGAIAGGRSQGA